MNRNILGLVLLIIALTGFSGCTDVHNTGNQDVQEHTENNSTEHENQAAGNEHGNQSESSNNRGNMVDFKGRKIEFSEIFYIEAPIEKVFPLLCPQREHDYIPGWNANIVWSVSGLAEEGAVFTSHGETWIITDYRPMETVNFVRFNSNIVTQLKVNISEEGDKTKLIWTQSQVGLTETGNIEVESKKPEDLANTAKVMEATMTYYLMTGNMVDEATLKKHIGGSGH